MRRSTSSLASDCALSSLQADNAAIRGEVFAPTARCLESTLLNAELVGLRGSGGCYDLRCYRVRFFVEKDFLFSSFRLFVTEHIVCARRQRVSLLRSSRSACCAFDIQVETADFLVECRLNADDRRLQRRRRLSVCMKSFRFVSRLSFRCLTPTMTTTTIGRRSGVVVRRRAGGRRRTRRCQERISFPHRLCTRVQYVPRLFFVFFFLTRHNTSRQSTVTRRRRSTKARAAL